MRSDNRKLNQLRPVRIVPGFITQASGSALIEVGKTRVICTASIEAGVPGWMRGQGKGWITSEYGMLPGSTGQRSARESTRGKVGGRTHEIQRLIGRSLRAIVPLEKIGERTVWVDCDVIEADGGTRTASITGAFVALYCAFDALVKAGSMEKVPLLDHVAAVSVGIVKGEPMVDLCYEEDSAADVDMNIVMTGGGRFIEIQGTAERATFDDAQAAAMMALGRQGIRELVEIQKSVLP